MKTKLILVSTCLVVLALSIGFMQWSAQTAGANDKPTQVLTSQTTSSPSEDSIDYTLVTPASGESEEEEKTTDDEPFPVRSENGALIIGSPDAPITITEYSSMSCGHCASFHAGALKDIEKDYVASGDVQFAFYPFPTNTPAMDAAKLLECVDLNDRYDFMNLLFEQQMSWAAPSINHRQKLMQYASLLGMSNDKAEACMDDKDMEQNIVAIIQQANAKYGVDSTPTFVIEPGEKVLVGSRPYGEFSTEIESILEQQQASE